MPAGTTANQDRVCLPVRFSPGGHRTRSGPTWAGVWPGWPRGATWPARWPHDATVAARAASTRAIPTGARGCSLSATNKKEKGDCSRGHRRIGSPGRTRGRLKMLMRPASRNIGEGGIQGTRLRMRFQVSLPSAHKPWFCSDLRSRRSSPHDCITVFKRAQIRLAVRTQCSSFFREIRYRWVSPPGQPSFCWQPLRHQGVLGRPSQPPWNVRRACISLSPSPSCRLIAPLLAGAYRR